MTSVLIIQQLDPAQTLVLQFIYIFYIDYNLRKILNQSHEIVMCEDVGDFIRYLTILIK